MRRAGTAIVSRGAYTCAIAVGDAPVIAVSSRETRPPKSVDAVVARLTQRHVVVHAAARRRFKRIVAVWCRGDRR